VFLKISFSLAKALALTKACARAGNRSYEARLIAALLPIQAIEEKHNEFMGERF